MISLPGVVLQPNLGGEIHTVQFVGCNVLEAFALCRLAAIFYLCKINYAVLFGYDINLADAGFPVTADNFMAGLLQMIGDGLLGG